MYNQFLDELAIGSNPNPILSMLLESNMYNFMLCYNEE